jgi:alpha-tubulin suppressor-like RCC1 family protein
VSGLGAKRCAYLRRTAAAVCVGMGFLSSPMSAAARPSAVSRSVLQAWGYNLDGELGDGTTTDTGTPMRVHVPPATVVIAARAGCNHALALTAGGRVLAWGDNSFGQLGDGTHAGRLAPVLVKLPAGTKVVAIAAGCDHNLALTSGGRLFAWGYNIDGELGDGTTVSSDSPVRVKLPAGTKIKAISAGYSSSLAATASGRVLAWGDNRYGQLGDGSNTASDAPVPVKLPHMVKAATVASGAFHNLAITTTGRVLAWGYNGHGQLGDGNITNADIPVMVKLPSGTKVTSVSAGLDHSVALTATGKILIWGFNINGQLGDGSTISSNRPVRVRLPARARAISAGRDHNLILTTAGRVFAWGYNFYGQLGDNTTASSDRPVQVKVRAGLIASAVGGGPGGEFSIAIVHKAVRNLRW